MNDDTIKEIFTYNELLHHINNSEDDDLIEWMFEEKIGHEVPLSRTHPNYKGSPHNLAMDLEKWGNYYRTLSNYSSRLSSVLCYA